MLLLLLLLLLLALDVDPGGGEDVCDGVDGVVRGGGSKEAAVLRDEVLEVHPLGVVQLILGAPDVALDAVVVL